MIHRLLSASIYIFSSLIGVSAFLAPFFNQGQGSSASNAPWLLSLVIALCFLGLLFEVQGPGLSAKSVALLGVLVSINSLLRFAEVAIPGPGGFTPVFLLIILSGYIFGGRIGFLMGAMTLFVSAIITGGIGPWLPYQMICAAWVGLSAPLVRPFAKLLGGPNSKGELLSLIIFGIAWGFIYGAIMNIWFWPYSQGDARYYWSAGISLSETIQRYAAFYMLTSFVWDTFGAIGNAVLLSLFGMPVLRTLRRFQRRLSFDYQPNWSQA